MFYRSNFSYPFPPVQAIAWLSQALSAARLPAPTANAATSTTLARLLTRRVPYESKAVLLAVGEATEITTSRRGGSCPGPGRSSRRRGVCSGRREGGDDLASLAKLSRTAAQSPLFPLAVPLVPPLPSLEGSGGEGMLGVEAVLAVGDGGGKGLGMVRDGGEGRGGEESAVVTAGLLLDAFERSPPAVMRAIRGATQQR